MTPQEKLIALAGGEDIEVTRTDGGKETVRVRQVSVRSFQVLARLAGDEHKLIAAVCEKPEEWIDGLTLASYERLVERNEAINGDFFQRWVRRQLARVEAFSPGAIDRLAGLPTSQN